MPPADAGRSLAAAQRMLWRIIVAPQGVEVALRDSVGRRSCRRRAAGRADPATRSYPRRDASACMPRPTSNAFAACRSRLQRAARASRRGAVSRSRDVHLAVHPPQHFSLRYAGARLPEFLRVRRSGRPLRSRWPWGADLARLEWALGEAFDAADSPTAGAKNLGTGGHGTLGRTLAPTDLRRSGSSRSARSARVAPPLRSGEGA